MTSGRFLSVVGAFALFVGACVGQDGGKSTGSGGAPGTGGANSSGGSSGTGTAGTSGSAGTGGAVSGTGGQASGGRGGSGGSTATGGAGAGSGGASGGAGAAGTSGSGGSAGAGGSTATGGAGAGSGGASGGAGAAGRGGRGGGRVALRLAEAPAAAALRLAEAPAPAAVRAGEVPAAAAPRVPSKGCGMSNGAKTLTTGGSSVMSALPTSTRLKITSGGMSREYIIDIPANYDPTHPYRLIFSWHQAYGSDTGNANGLHPANDGPNFDAKNYAYFGLHREATAANDPAIFVAPGGIGNLPWDYNRDVVLFDDLLALVDANLCIDDSRVFTTGFSFGAMMSYALTLGRPAKLRGAVAMAAANYNFTQPTNAHVRHRVHGDDRHERWHVSVGQRHDGREGLRPSARQGQWLHDSRREQHPDDDGWQQEIRLLRLRRVQGGLSRQSVHVRWPAHPVERG